MKYAFIITLFLSFHIWAQTSSEIFEKAKDLHRQNRTEGAVQVYDEAIRAATSRDNTQIIYMNKFLAYYDEAFIGNKQLRKAEMNATLQEIISINSYNLYGRIAKVLKKYINMDGRNGNETADIYNEVLSLYQEVKSSPTLSNLIGEIYKLGRGGEKFAINILTETLDNFQQNHLYSEFACSSILQYVLYLNRAKVYALDKQFEKCKSDYEKCKLYLPTSSSYVVYEVLKSEGYY